MIGHAHDLLFGIVACCHHLRKRCACCLRRRSRALRTCSPKAQRTMTQHGFMLLGVNTHTHCTSMLMSVTCDAGSFLTHLHHWQTGHMKARR
jgi:hypothetical protein